jgi:hypothetical protein
MNLLNDKKEIQYLSPYNTDSRINLIFGTSLCRMKRESAEKIYININCKKFHNLFSLPLVISVIMLDMMGGTQCSHEDTKVHKRTNDRPFSLLAFFFL